MWQATLQQMLSSPAHFQRVMQAFTNAQPYNIPTDQSASSLGLFAPVNGLQPQLAYPLPAYPRGQTALPPATPIADPLAIAPAQASDPQHAALLNNSQQLNRTYQDAAQINADMDSLQSNIHTLIHDMRLENTLIEQRAMHGRTKSAFRGFSTKLKMIRTCSILVVDDRK